MRRIYCDICEKEMPENTKRVAVEGKTIGTNSVMPDIEMRGFDFCLTCFDRWREIVGGP